MFRQHRVRSAFVRLVRCRSDSSYTHRPGKAGGGGRFALDLYNEEVIEQYAREAVDAAVRNLDARPAPAGSIPVVLLLLACFSFTSQATEIRTDPPNGQNDSDIEIVIHLEPWQDGKFYDRLGLEGDTYTILGVQLPYVTIPVRPGRNLAGIVEIAAMKNRQMRYGYNSARDFMTQFDKKMDELARQAKEKQ